MLFRSNFVIFDAGHTRLYGAPRRLIRTSDEQRTAALHDLYRNRRNLLGGLAQPKHDFGKSLTDRAMVIDLRKAKVRKGLVPKCRHDAAMGFDRIGSAVPDLIKKRTQLQRGIHYHCRIMMDWTTGQRAHLR